ncbi:hypothetical protein [Kitasatospora sp. NPDC004289]
MDFEPEGTAERAADVLGTVDRRGKGDLRRFETSIEDRGTATEAWRGRISPN